MSITAMKCKDDRNDLECREVSDRFVNEFQNKHWNWLYEDCMVAYDNEAAMYRDERLDNMRKSAEYGDIAYHHKREAA